MISIYSPHAIIQYSLPEPPQQLENQRQQQRTHIYHVFEGPKPRRDAPLPKTGGRAVYRCDITDTDVAKQLWGRFLRDQQSDDTTTYIDQLVSLYD